MLSDRKLNIAIDGPAGAGKSTIAKLVAGKLGYLYIDTGAMYRAITWHLLQHGVDIKQKELVADIVTQLNLELLPGKDGQENQVWVNGVDVTENIRHPIVNAAVPQVAIQPAVRQYLVKQQQRLSAPGGVVMDGRDIGTVVLPNANVKIFLTAALAERAQRRWLELKATGSLVSLAQVQQEIMTRDEKDQKRTISPLRQATDAILLDTTGLSIDEVVHKVLVSIERVQRRSGV